MEAFIGAVCWVVVKCRTQTCSSQEEIKWPRIHFSISSSGQTFTVPILLVFDFTGSRLHFVASKHWRSSSSCWLILAELPCWYWHVMNTCKRLLGTLDPTSASLMYRTLSSTSSTELQTSVSLSLLAEGCVCIHVCVCSGLPSVFPHLGSVI